MGDGSMAVMRKIKDIFDPNEILNPDKILDAKGKKY
jgi:FAD/FMN-containing dehydrogenase